MNLPKILKHYFPLLLLVVFLTSLFTAKSVSAINIIEDGGGTAASIIWFKEALKKSEQNLESFVGGKELLPEAEGDKLKQKPSGIVPGVVNSLNAMIIGLPLTQEEINAGYIPNGGAVAGVSNMIAGLYINPPVSGVQYLADLGKNLGIVTPAYAQAGIGWQGLQPILPLWKAFRNLAYLFFVLIFVIVGFAIMFRVKISPQAVITIQSALPRIVMALILVTFSYAIAGFLIDLIYVAIYLIIAFLSGAGLIGLPEGAKGLVFQQNMWTSFRFLFDTVGGLGSAIYNMVAGMEINWLELIPHAEKFQSMIGFSYAILAVLIFALAALYALFKLFFTLLMSYISIILGVIFAPFQIMLDVLPGQSGFGNWLRNLIANIMVFPAVATLFLISGILLHSGSIGAPPSGGEQRWVPPFLNLGGGASNISALIGVGMLLMAPKIAEMVKEALKVKPLPYGAAVGEAVGWGAGLGAAAITRGVREIPFVKERAIAREAELKARVELKKEELMPQLKRGGI